MRQSGLAGVALAWAGRLLAVAAATWVGRVLAVATLGAVLLAGLAEAIAWEVERVVLPAPPLAVAAAGAVPAAVGRLRLAVPAPVVAKATVEPFAG